MTEDTPAQTPPVEDAIAATTAQTATESWTTASPPPQRDLVLFLIAISAVLLVTTILFGLMAFAPHMAPIKSGSARLAIKAQEEAAITSVAKRFAKNFLTVGYRTIDADFQRVTADATGKFKDRLQQVRTSTRKQFIDRKGSSSGAVTQAIFMRHQAENAVVRIVADRTVSNAKNSTPTTAVIVLDITLVKTSEGWKVDDLRQLGAEGTK